VTITSELREFYDERRDEIRDYLNLLRAVETAAGSGAPRIREARAGEASYPITAPQQRILYASVYLQLYNLVEAVVTRCIGAVADAAATNSRWRPVDLNENLRREWVRHAARTHIDLTPENRLKSAMKMCNDLVGQLPLVDLQIDPGGGGNWDDEAIYKLSERLGCRLTLSRSTTYAVKRPVRDGLGAMKLVKDRRNSLAHGSISFTECADGVTVSELESMTGAVEAYLAEAVGCFTSYIDVFEFLAETSRPDGKP